VSDRRVDPERRSNRLKFGHATRQQVALFSQLILYTESKLDDL